MPSFPSISKSKAKYPPTLPSTWPPRHVKCSIPTCYFPNPPQAAPGQYTCKSGLYSGGLFCEGVFRVSRSVADDVMHNHRQEMQRLDAAERSAQLKAALEEERKCSEARKYQQQEEARRLAAAELAAILERDRAHSPRHGRKYPEELSLGRRPAQRKRHGSDDIPPNSHEYHTRPTVAPQSHVLRRMEKRLPQTTHQGPREAAPAVPIRYHPNPQPHIRGLPIVPEPQPRVPPARPPRRDLEYQYTGR
ncbi:hypothetical protein FPV67DRAFT_897756 [Lyophyllum atratum]|nr:hypothetical protein FPV67DRAFT_897756 [Lyophyllum atratum]